MHYLSLGAMGKRKKMMGPLSSLEMAAASCWVGIAIAIAFVFGEDSCCCSRGDREDSSSCQRHCQRYSRPIYCCYNCHVCGFCWRVEPWAEGGHVPFRTTSWTEVSASRPGPKRKPAPSASPTRPNHELAAAPKSHRIPQ